jgi:XTP/dITP diphosphohydrolase
MLRIIIASKNVHKIREFRSILKTIPKLDILSLLDFPQYTPLPEDKPSFKENAIVKALHAAQTLNAWVLADDSGLVVPALGGAPGVYSARYAGDPSNDSENRKKLLREMENLLDPKREAYYVCHLVLASPQGVKKETEGFCEGKIITEERGNHGFGYDPLFIKHDYNKTFGELEESVKNRVSHRRKALDKMLITIEAIANQNTPVNV